MAMGTGHGGVKGFSVFHSAAYNWMEISICA